MAHCAVIFAIAQFSCSVLAHKKLFGGLAHIWVRRWKLHFPPYRLVKVSWKSVQPFPRMVVSYLCTIVWRTEKKKKTRSAWQSPTWGRPAPEFRVESQFSYSKFLSQQRHLPNNPENYTLEPRGIWNCVSLQCTSTSGVSIFVTIPLSFVDHSSPRRLENFGEDIPTSPEVIEAHTLNFKPILNFHH